MEKRKEFEQRLILGKEIKAININHEAPMFDPEKVKDLEVAYGVEPENIRSFKGGGKDTKQQILYTIEKTTGPVTIFFNTHGLKDRLVLDAEGSMENSVIDYSDLADALSKRKGRLEEVNIVFGSCYSYNYAQNIKSAINALYDSKQSEDKGFPTIITTANKDQETRMLQYNSVVNNYRSESGESSFAHSLIKFADKGAPLTGAQILSVERDPGWSSSNGDPAILVPSSPEDINKLNNLFDLKISPSGPVKESPSVPLAPGLLEIGQTNPVNNLNNLNNPNLIPTTTFNPVAAIGSLKTEENLQEPPHPFDDNRT
jgi:hypothetical protein